MRFKELKGLSNEEASRRITACPQIQMRKVLDNPKILLNKVIVFRGNYDGFDTRNLCARTFQYISAENRWKVSDYDLFDMFYSSYEHHFLKEELENQFRAFCKDDSIGFIMDM